MFRLSTFLLFVSSKNCFEMKLTENGSINTIHIEQTRILTITYRLYSIYIHTASIHRVPRYIGYKMIVIWCLLRSYEFRSSWITSDSEIVWRRTEFWNVGLLSVRLCSFLISRLSRLYSLAYSCILLYTLMNIYSISEYSKI